MKIDLNLTGMGVGVAMVAVGVAMLASAAPTARDAGALHVPLTSQNWTSLDGGQLYLTTTRTAGAYLTKPPAYIIVHSDGRRIQLTIDDLFDLVETLQSLKKGPGLVTAGPALPPGTEMVVTPSVAR